MRIVLLSDGELRGGAGIAAGRLATALVTRGHDIHWVSPRPDGGRHPWRSVPFHLSPLARVGDGLCRRSSSALAFRLRCSIVGRELRMVLEELAPDVVNLHNIHGARWSAAVLDAVPAGALPVWTLHDMWTLTGRCAYAFDCRQYLARCTADCPTPAEYPALSPRSIAMAHLQRSEVLQRRPDAIAVAPSRWLAREAVGSLWRRHRVAHIPNGVPLDEYFPESRAAARESLGLGLDERVVIVMAERLGERRKGWQFLQSALEQIGNPALRLLLVGDGSAGTAVPAPHLVTALGRVDEVGRLRRVINAADLLVHPAPVDNLPNVVLEAMACGVPTVAFHVGGLPDMVRPGISGWLAETVSANALAETLLQALLQVSSAPTGCKLSVACRELALRQYTPDLQARRYEALLAGETYDLVWPEPEG